MRFLNDGEKKKNKKAYLPLVVFLVVFAVFCYAVDAMSSGSESRQKVVLEQAVNDSVVYCYSIEGSYPESIEYLEENYGLTYDKDRFYVGYRLQGSNIMPDITIVDLNDSNAAQIAGLGKTSAISSGGVS